ncbi:hypothetical protein FAES_3215 [Fibrella aestuarina BUZ 2]|uniref:Uncharacterized protein n=1 Tax=Fibrella aestuarina BUZ 2 TaxID=1166018 RepID=I0KAS1_9BACT|nr:hypothetical protein [Fibrella aestuarina]CCH01224.1 hypothetical protein FAES_3215 [Fibrella aestuarina BUZ 2]
MSKLPQTPTLPAEHEPTSAAEIIQTLAAGEPTGDGEPTELSIGEVAPGKFFFPEDTGLLNRDVPVPSSGADRWRDRVMGVKPESAVVVVPPRTQPQPEPITPEAERAQLYNRALQSLTEKYNKPLWRPTLTLSQGSELLEYIIGMELARENRTISEEDVDMDIMFNLLLYFWGHEKCPYDLTRGIYLYGEAGVGKTFVFDCFATLLREIAPPAEQMRVIPTEDMMDEVSVKKSFAALTPYKFGLLTMDDLGREERVAQAYSERRDGFAHLLTFRYRQFVQNRLKTHFTSNLLPKQLESPEHYGTVLGDRFKQWTQCIHYQGRSKRNKSTLHHG